jgi:osmotically-inducible protein OsmY
MTAVQNRIVVTPETTLSPTSATAGIVAALARHAQAAAGDIHVAVNGNDIILTGTTSSLVERSYAENAAWCTPGAATVENLLTVSP